MYKFFEVEHKWYYIVIIARTLFPSAFTSIAHLIDFLSV